LSFALGQNVNLFRHPTCDGVERNFTVNERLTSREVLFYCHKLIHWNMTQTWYYTVWDNDSKFMPRQKVRP